MNIWLVNQYAIPPTQPGITRHHTFARELNRRGHDVTIIAASFDHVTRREMYLGPTEVSRIETMNGVRFLWLKTPPYDGNTKARVRNMLTFARLIWRQQGTRQLPRPDVIVGSSPHLFGAFAAWRVARVLGVPFVLEVRDLWPEALIEGSRLRRGHLIVRVLALIERTLYRKASRIIALLPKAPAYIAERGGDLTRIDWIPNGVMVDEIRAQLPNQTEPLTAMYLGAHGLFNSLHTVVEAAALLRAQGYADKIQFRFVGDGPRKPELIYQAEQAGLGNMVRFDEPVPKWNVSDVLAEAHVLIMPLLKGGLVRGGISPNKLFDYMAAARPIVAIMDASNPVMEAGAGLHVPAGDAAALAEALKALLAMSSQERWEMGLRGRRYVKEHPDMTVLSKRFEACLQNAVCAFATGVQRPSTIRSLYHRARTTFYEKINRALIRWFRLSSGEGS